MIAAVILAAGASQRMGEPKQLLPYRGKALLVHVVDAARASAVDRVVVVTGAHATAVESVVDGAVIVRNPDHERGNVSSLACGVTAVPADAFVVLTADQPGVDTNAIDALVTSWDRQRPWAAVTEYDDRLGHPFLLSSRAADDVISTGGEKALGRLLIDAGDDRVVRVRAEGPAPIDVNTPEDYERLLNGAEPPL